jgi:hypothetical protein
VPVDNLEDDTRGQVHILGKTDNLLTNHIVQIRHYMRLSPLRVQHTAGVVLSKTPMGNHVRPGRWAAVAPQHSRVN